jgi:hypothetical protein
LARIESYRFNAPLLAYERRRYELGMGYREAIELVGGFAPWVAIHHDGGLTPMRYTDTVAVDLYLDSITGAVESGLVDSDLWPEQLFATRGDLTKFLEALSEMDDQGTRVHDRWWQALAILTGDDSVQQNMASSSDIADAVAHALVTTDRLRRIAKAQSKDAPSASKVQSIQD